jgi:hypothetical protein
LLILHSPLRQPTPQPRLLFLPFRRCGLSTKRTTWGHEEKEAAPEHDESTNRKQTRREKKAISDGASQTLSAAVTPRPSPFPIQSGSLANNTNCPSPATLQQVKTRGSLRSSRYQGGSYPSAPSAPHRAAVGLGGKGDVGCVAEFGVSLALRLGVSPRQGCTCICACIRGCSGIPMPAEPQRTRCAARWWWGGCGCGCGGGGSGHRGWCP